MDFWFQLDYEKNGKMDKGIFKVKGSDLKSAKANLDRFAAKEGTGGHIVAIYCHEPSSREIAQAAKNYHSSWSILISRDVKIF